MRSGLRGLIPLCAALLLRVSTAANSSDLSAPHNLNVKCDSYGVVVDWTSSRPQEFLLELKPNIGTLSRTWETRQNISAHLQDTGYNQYTVEVKTADEKYTLSKSFTFNSLKTTADIICNLTFPPVVLIPGDRELIFRFRNPLHQYRHTPALRNLTGGSELCYSVSSTLDSQANTWPHTCPDQSLRCESETCEGTIAFPEEQEKYCVTLFGFIRQTYVEETKPLCYHDRLKPRVPTILHFVPVFSVLAIIPLIALILFLAKFVNKTIKNKCLSKYPEFLTSKILNLPIPTPLILQREHFENNLMLEPAKRNPINAAVLESITLLDRSANSSQHSGSSLHLIRFEDNTGEDGDEHGDRGRGADTSAGTLSPGYDSPHAHIEMSPGDVVNTYAKGGSLP